MSNQSIPLLSTEMNNPRTVDIDRVDTLSVVNMIHEEDRVAVEAMNDALPALAAMAEAVTDRLQNGGRLFYVGAGTSGRIGVLDASELPATYGVDPSLCVAVVPGGYETLPDARLGDEDDREGAVADLKAVGLTAKDALVGIAASGRTPYTHQAMCYAKEQGAFVGAIVNVNGSVMAQTADVAAVIDTGAEAIEGSTRMKAGTTQKLALNMLSTTVMIKLGKVYHNRMIEITAINEKMVVRCERMLKELTGADGETVSRVLKESGYHVKTACAAIMLGCDVSEAKQRLAANGGSLGGIL